jgi:hypothetical protein
VEVGEGKGVMGVIGVEVGRRRKERGRRGGWEDENVEMLMKGGSLLREEPGGRMIVNLLDGVLA